jgi:four helix bundle protein
MALAISYADLEVYKLSRKLSGEIFELTTKFPREEIYSLTDQIRRSSRSIGAQIAEAWAKRKYERHFISKLTDAEGERFETQHWIQTAEDCGLLPGNISLDLKTRYDLLGKMLNTMIGKSGHFCNP